MWEHPESRTHVPIPQFSIVLHEWFKDLVYFHSMKCHPNIQRRESSQVSDNQVKTCHPERDTETGLLEFISLKVLD